MVIDMGYARSASTKRQLAQKHLKRKLVLTHVHMQGSVDEMSIILHVQLPDFLLTIDVGLIKAVYIASSEVIAAVAELAGMAA